MSASPRIYLLVNKSVFTYGTADTVSTVFIAPHKPPVFTLRLTLFDGSGDFFYYTMVYDVPRRVSDKTQPLASPAGPTCVMRRDPVNKTYMFEIMRSSLRDFVSWCVKEVDVLKLLSSVNKRVYY